MVPIDIVLGLARQNALDVRDPDVVNDDDLMDAAIEQELALQSVEQAMEILQDYTEETNLPEAVRGAIQNLFGEQD